MSRSSPRSPLLRRASGLLPSVLALLAAGSCAPPPPPPNVVLVVLDTLRTDHMSAYGYPYETTPVMDRLAADGVLFTDCTAQASWTMPSMISLMTGLPIFTTIYRVPDDEPMLAERFAESGYRTGAFVANSLVSEQAGFRRGVDDWSIREQKTRYWRAEELVDKGLAFLDGDDGRPFLLWMHFLDTHNPYDPPRGGPFKREPEEVFEDFELETIQRAIEDAPEAERPALRFQLPALTREVDRYDGELAYLDSQIGRFLETLDERGLSDDTYVVVVSDHGETLFRRPEHPDRVAEVREWKQKVEEPMRLADYLKMEHDRYVYEELVRTPFILRGPGIPAGQVSDALVSNLDVLPTLLGLCGLEGDEALAGRDLSAFLRDARPVPDADFVPTFCDSEQGAKLPDGRKVVLPGANMARRHGYTPKVYDLDADPAEQTPLPLDDETARVLERLEHLRENDPFKLYSGRGADPETIEALREMGYIR